MWLFLYFLLVTGIVQVMLWISRQKFGPTFSLRKVCLSNLGNPKLNPTGYRWTNRALVINGITYFFLYLWALVISWQRMNVLAIGIFILGTLASGSSIGVALIYDDSKFKLHFMLGSLYFVCFMVPMVIFLFFILINVILGTLWFSLAVAILIQVIAISFGLILIYSLATRKGGRSAKKDLEWYLYWLVILFHGFFTAILSFFP